MRAETTGMSSESTESTEVEDEEDSDWESEEEIVKNVSEKDVCEHRPKGDYSKEKSHDDFGKTSDGFVRGEDIRNIDKKIQDLVDGSKKENIIHEGPISSAKKSKFGILERLAKCLKKNNSVSNGAESNVKEMSGSERKQINEVGLTYQPKIINNRLLSEGNAPEQMLETDDNTQGFTGRLFRSLKSIGNTSKSESHIIHVKPASPETCVDNCKD